MLLVNLFPAAKHSRDLVDNIIQKYGNIFYKKNVHLNSLGSFNYMLQLYKGESWAGDWNNNFAGYREKQSFCFKDSLEDMTVYLIDTDDSTALKEEIRSLYNIGNHSVHINDTHEETLRLSRCLFNKNSLHFLNNCQIKNYQKFLSQLSYFENFIVENELEEENYCITASSVLSAYGLREGLDLDYLHFDSILTIDGHSDIHSHNKYGEDRYPVHRDDIIFNPDNHFYYGNIKFASLNIVNKLKKKRGEQKDIIDINLIEEII